MHAVVPVAVSILNAMISLTIMIDDIMDGGCSDQVRGH
jgi:hypothetical protein